MISFLIMKILCWMYGAKYCEDIQAVFVVISGVELLLLAIAFVFNVVKKVQDELEKMKEKKK